jgi:protoporphyrinogen oxidase
MSRVAIVGGGFTGLSAALELSKKGYAVHIFESEDDIGGLAGTFELEPGVRVEKFYHHWFSSDVHILTLIEELGLLEKVTFKNSNTGFYYANTIFRLSSPLDLLRFSPLPMLDRIRVGLMALYARRIEDWKSLESQTAANWIIKVAGKRAFETVWGPLLKGKFGSESEHVSAVWFWNKLKLRGGSRDSKGKEQLAYFDGTFGSLTDSIREALLERGVEIHLNSSVERLLIENGVTRGLRVNGEDFLCKKVLVTAPLPTFLELTEELPPVYVEQLEKIRFLGNICLVLRLKKSLSDSYWLNVSDPDFPFVGIVEHTQIDSTANYGDSHIVYLSKYLSIEDELYSYSPEELLVFALPHIQRLFPEFQADWILQSYLWKAKYSQPVISLHYSELVPDCLTPIEGLYLATMAQVYPEDRGTNYAVRLGKEAADEIERGGQPKIIS